MKLKEFVVERQYIHYETVKVMARSARQARGIAVRLGEPAYVNCANWLGPNDWLNWEILDESDGTADNHFDSVARGFSPEPATPDRGEG